MKKVITILNKANQRVMAFFDTPFVQDNKNFFCALLIFWIFYFALIAAIVKSSPACNVCGSKKFVHRVEITTQSLLKQIVNICEECLERLKGELRSTIKKVQ